MDETPQWVSLSLDPGTAEFLGLPPRLQVPLSALQSIEEGLSVSRLAQALNQAVERHPALADDTDVRHFLSRSDHLERLENYLRVGNLTFAGQVAKELHDKNPDDPLALSTLGRVALLEERFEEAADRLQRALKEAPSHAPTRLEYALALAGRGHTAEALSRIKELEAHRAVGLLAKVWRWELERANLVELGSRLEFLRRILQQRNNSASEAGELEQRFPKNPEARYLVAVHPSWKEEPEAGRIAALKSVLRDTPEHTRARVLLAQLLRRAGDPQEAMRILKEAPHPTEPPIAASVGSAWEHLGHPEKAREAYRAVFESNLETLSHEALIQAGQGLLRVGGAEENRMLLEDAIRARPQDSLPRQILARLEELGGHPEAAERRLREAQRECGQTPGLAYALGDFLRRAGRDAEALGIFKALVNREPSLPWGYRGLGDMALKEKPQKAVEHYAQALTLDPDTPIPGHDYLQGVAALRVGKFDEANAWLARAVAGEPDNARYWGDFGATHYYCGRVSAAVEATERAAALDPENPGFAHNLHQYYGEQFRAAPLRHWRAWFTARKYKRRAGKLARRTQAWKKDLWGGSDSVGSSPGVD